MTHADTGLTAAEVAERIASGAVNDVPAAPSRTTGQIIRANVFTRFNALIGSLFVVVAACGAYRDGLFAGVIVANTLIGVVQELRAKRTLDRLVIVSAPKVSSPVSPSRSSSDRAMSCSPAPSSSPAPGGPGSPRSVPTHMGRSWRRRRGASRWCTASCAP